MNGTVILITFFQALWDVVASGFIAAPALWTAFVVFVAACTFSVWDLLERRGLRAACWGVVSASAFGLWVALA